MIEKILEIEILLSHASSCLNEAKQKWQEIAPDQEIDALDYAKILSLGFIVTCCARDTNDCLSGVMELRHSLEQNTACLVDHGQNVER